MDYLIASKPLVGTRVCDVKIGLHANWSIRCANDVESTMISSSKGINYELVMEAKEESQTCKIGNIEAKRLGIYHIIGIDIDSSTKLIKDVSIIFFWACWWGCHWKSDNFRFDY